MFLSLLIVMFSINKNVSAQAAPPIEPGVSRELARWRAAHMQDVRYKLNLTLEKMSPTLKGSIEISLKTDADQIILDWRKIKGKEQFASVSNVNINGNVVKFEEINEHLVFKEGVRQGENVIKLDFTSPIATSGAAVTRYVDKEDGAEYIYSLFVPSDASTAFPVFDQPDLKAKFTPFISAPKGWKVITNYGNVIESPPNRNPQADRIYYTAIETQPLSTYVFGFSAGDFERVIDTSNESLGSVYVRKSQAEKFKQHAAEVFRLNREAVKYLESYFDYKFPFPKYDLVLIPEFPFGGMEHAGATFLREDRIIFPQEPTANDFITRGNLIFHEAAHQWFGDTVTMRWFDDLWLKEGFAEFMAYKTMEKVLPQYNAWKAFYERNKPLAYLTDSTKGTTPIYQEIPNLSAAKSAYGNIVYRKAPSFLKQAEFYLGEDKFQTAVRAFLKKHQFANAEWTDLIKEFEAVGGQTRVKDFANGWVKQRGLPIVRIRFEGNSYAWTSNGERSTALFSIRSKSQPDDASWLMKTQILIEYENVAADKFQGNSYSETLEFRAGASQNQKNKSNDENVEVVRASEFPVSASKIKYIFPNYEDYGYGIFLLDEKSRNYVLASIQNERNDFLRSMMWGTLWDSVREAELNPKDYVELAVKNVSGEKDELTIQTILSRVATAMNYYVPEKQSAELAPRLEKVVLDRMTNAETSGQRIVFYRAFLNLAVSEAARQKLKDVLNGKFEIQGLKLKTKDKFDIITRLLILNDADAPQLLAGLEKTETSDEAKRYAYAARAGIVTTESKRKYFDDFLNNKEISESWIESAFVPFNSVRHAELTLPFLEKALAELPNLKRNRKIFFVNGWLAAFLGGQRSEQALAIVNRFLADNPNLDRDLRLKILENVDGLERSVKIRKKFAD